MIRIQALEWAQGRIQDLTQNNVTTDWPFIPSGITLINIIKINYL